MTKFENLNIKSIPRSKNSNADMSANAASNLSPSDDFTHDRFSMELMYKTSIPNNIINWWIFDDDPQIKDFIHLKDTFKGSVIDDEQHESLLQASTSEDKLEFYNPNPKNIVGLDKYFDLRDRFKKPTNTKTNSLSLKYEYVNLDME